MQLKALSRTAASPTRKLLLGTLLPALCCAYGQPQETQGPLVEVQLVSQLTIYQHQQQSAIAATPTGISATTVMLEHEQAITAPPTFPSRLALSTFAQQPELYEDGYWMSSSWGWCPVYTTTSCDTWNGCCATYWPTTTTVYCDSCHPWTTTVWAAPPPPLTTTVVVCEACEHQTQQAYNGYCSTLYEVGPGLPTTRPGWCGTILILEAGAGQLSPGRDGWWGICIVLVVAFLLS